MLNLLKNLRSRSAAPPPVVRLDEQKTHR